MFRLSTALGLAAWFAAGTITVFPTMAQDEDRSDSLDSRLQTRVVLLGTGTPVPDPRRSGPAVAIVTGGRAYLVDSGPGVVRRAAEAYEQGEPALSANQLNHVFITHLHSDHTVGLADLIFTPWTVGRRTPLEVFGPPGVKDMTRHLREAYKEDIRIRVTGHEEADETGSQVNAHEVKPGVVFEDRNVKVTAIKVDHGTWEHAFGYRFDTPDRSIVVSGDTAWSESLIEGAKGCDVLVHEVFCASDFANLHPEPYRYHSSFHTSTEELGKIAAKIQPKLLILYHQLGWSPPETFIEEVKENFDGKVVYGNDLDVY